MEPRARCSWRRPPDAITQFIRRLPPDTAVVDLVQRVVAPPRQAGQDRAKPELHYDAFVLRRPAPGQHRGVEWVKMGPAAPIDDAVDVWRDLLRRPDAPRADTPQSAGRQVRRLVWEKIAPHLESCRAVIVIPDQGLTRIPWSALPGEEPGTCLLHEYAIGTATHAQAISELLARPRRKPTAARMLALGGVKYDEATARGDRPDVDRLVSRSRAPVGVSGRAAWKPLPATEREIEVLRRLWADRGPTTLLAGSDAGKSRLCRELPQSRYVHLATHGFFAGPKHRSALNQTLDVDPLGWAGGSSIGLWDGPAAGQRSPLLLSGLAPAGANLPPQTDSLGVPLGNDGLLTAEEIVELDLEENDPVVLSACETGLGNVAGGEGVFGLQRAFHLAGARTVVASLWEVDDAATQALMVEFYKNLWERKLGKVEALRQAQLAMLARYSPNTGALRSLDLADKPLRPPDGSKPPPSEPGQPLPPFYWAAFVLSGDWR